MTTTFTINGATYTTNATGKYFYVTDDTRFQKRVSRKEYEEAKHEYEVAQAVAEAEESSTDEEIAEIIEAMNDEEPEEHPVEKKARKAKKNAAFTYCPNGVDVITLTEKQVDFIRHLPDTCFWEQGLDSCVWIDCLCDDIKGQFAGKPMTVGAMISTICEKGLGTRAANRKGPRGGKCTSFALTEMGKQVAAELGLN